MYLKTGIMRKNIIEDTTFEGIDYSSQALVAGNYEFCRFVGCNFTGLDLSGLEFEGCTFQDCNLSMAKLNHTALRDTTFKACKLLGLRFEDCNSFLFSVHFDGCILQLASFLKMKLKQQVFKNCNLQEADFSGCDLSEAVFKNCDLSRAVFEQSLLEKADLRTAYNYTIDPERNRIRKAKFSRDGLAGLLDKYDLVIE